jgi:hypothetical protein
MAQSPPQKVNCDTVLPNGKTVGQAVNQVVQAINQTMSDTEQAGGDPLAAGLVDYFFDVNSNGPIDFKNNFRGQASPGLLGDAGNFAYGAISGYMFGTGSFGQYIALSGAGYYAQRAGKQGPGVPFVQAPYGADLSALQNVPAGVLAGCVKP